jgi:type IV pilus assembly protein PilO
MTMTTERYAPGTDTLAGPTYPTAFGITFTPTVSGILIALAGAALAGWMALNLIGPKLAETQALRDRIAQKEQDLKQKEATVRDIQAIVARVNQAKVRNTEVRGLFSSQQLLDTLLLDLNRIIASSNAQLQKFTPDYGLSGTITDSSLGPELNNKLKRQVTDVAFEGTFNQTLEIMRTIDRLQTVLVLRDFKMELKPPAGGENPGPANITTCSFKLYAYVPLTKEELAALPPPAPSADATAGTPAPQ